MTRKSKYTSEQLVKHIENKGIKFELCTEFEAKKFLEESNYYFKLASYRENFEKNNEGKYIELDFQYLIDLSIIDMRLRYIIIQMCLDIEHVLKTKILNSISDDCQEDGYTIVDEYYQFIQGNKEDIFNHIAFNNRHYLHQLFNRYQKDIPIWVICELFTFGNLTRFIEFYYNKTRDKDYKELSDLLKYAKNVRNCAAHNSPILIHIKQRDLTSAAAGITQSISKIDSISDNTRRNKLKNKRLHDIVTLFYLHSKYVKSEGIKVSRHELLNEWINRAKKHQEYYLKNNHLSSTFIFLEKVINYY